VCTLTWIRAARGFELFFNRDEARTRGAAEPPRVREIEGVRCAAPSDADGGGTWIGVNEHGVAACLLNGYRPSDTGERAWTSRGLLVVGVLAARDLAEVRARVERADLGRFRAFAMVAFAPGARPLAFEHQGSLAVRVLGDADRPRTSSSLDPIGAGRARRELFARMTAGRAVDAELLARFHASHEPERGALSPCMHRDDAHTVSFTRVRVGARRVELAYVPGAPCQGAPAVSVALDRRRGVAASA
jgi:hypothetical protein